MSLCSSCCSCTRTETRLGYSPSPLHSRDPGKSRLLPTLLRMGPQRREPSRRASGTRSTPRPWAHEYTARYAQISSSARVHRGVLCLCIKSARSLTFPRRWGFPHRSSSPVSHLHPGPLVVARVGIRWVPCQLVDTPLLVRASHAAPRRGSAGRAISPRHHVSYAWLCMSFACTAGWKPMYRWLETEPKFLLSDKFSQQH